MSQVFSVTLEAKASWMVGVLGRAEGDMGEAGVGLSRTRKRCWCSKTTV